MYLDTVNNSPLEFYPYVFWQHSLSNRTLHEDADVAGTRSTRSEEGSGFRTHDPKFETRVLYPTRPHPLTYWLIEINDQCGIPTNIQVA